ncbi:SUMF1/EgtB/PvdO family nonheme iron enzyme [uncultured Neptuniibacter sp.]|uniref:formylglycine-generating enzyme family protein n=1 Tax=uncultured Neptuniibacter sp. TaxID=502143 RepID=UPI002617D8BD|nr:SUMF1/EgtB/PvdO family nonheme iron enzyme [uncultured Neptuniibacter sp.]
MSRNLNFTALMLVGVAANLSAAPDKVLIEAGAFNMGCSQGDGACENDEAGAGGVTVNVPAFELDRFEVTVSSYTACIEAGICVRPKDHQRNQYCNLGASGRENHPVNCVDWQEALSFCQWKGGRLPFEAEWEKAARAKTDTAFPWGERVSCKQAILDDGVTQGSVPGEPDGCGEDRTWPVGSRKANMYGLHDMHGNAGEWTMNWYEKSGIARYANGDLKGPEQGRQRVVRGGSWDENRANLRSSFRNVKPPVSGRSVYGSIGFRCAYDVK